MIETKDNKEQGHHQSTAVEGDHSKYCKTCETPPSKHKIINYDEIKKIGEVYCLKCGFYVRQASSLE